MTWFGWAVCSAFLSAGAAITQKKILLRVGALEFSFLVSAAILVVALFIPLSTNVAVPFMPTLALLIGKSLVGGAAFFLVMLALERNQISTALPLLGLTPAIAALLAFLALGESLSGWECSGIALMIAGTYVLEMKPGRRMFLPAAGGSMVRRYAPIVGALALFAVSSVADRLLLGTMQIPPLVVLFYQSIVYCGLFGALLLGRRESFRGVLDAGRQQLPLIAAVALLTVAYRAAQLEATVAAPIALVLAVKRSSILIASFFGGRLFADQRLAPKLVGGAMIVAAGFLILRNVA